LEDIGCPFCEEKEFDLIGLKHHLNFSCQNFEDTISIGEEQNLRIEKGE